MSLCFCLSDGLLFPGSPLDWDSFTDPEYLFTAVPTDDPPPGQCRSLIHGLLSGRPVSWEVTVNLEHLLLPEGQETTDAEVSGGGGEGERESWEEIIHQLAARSIIRDFEKMAEKENQIGHGEDEKQIFVSLIHSTLLPLTVQMFYLMVR